MQRSSAALQKRFRKPRSHAFPQVAVARIPEAFPQAAIARTPTASAHEREMSTRGEHVNVTRRSFLKASALGLGAAALSEATPFTAAADESHQTNLTGKWVSSSCQGCTSFCPVKVWVQDGRAVRVKGNPNCTATHGQMCPKASFALHQLYDPDRIKVPMKRTNPQKGRGIDPGFVPITWDEALDTIADKWMELHDNKESQKFMFIKGRSSEVGDVLYHYLPALMGTPNYYGHSTLCAEAEKFASWAVNGIFDYRDYDLPHCKYCLMWSTDPIASNRQTPATINGWGAFMDAAHIVVIDPRFSATAAKADTWLPIIPGTDGALASAIAHVILTSGKWNRSFVGDFKSGPWNFDQAGSYDTKVNLFVAGEEVDEERFSYAQCSGLVKWWNLELKDKTPEWAAPICGIDAKTIRSVALDFAKYGQNALSWVSPGTTNQPRGIYGAMGAEALNGLVGSFENEGGEQHAASVSVGSFPDHRPYRDSLAKKWEKQPHADGRHLKEFLASKSGKVGTQVLTNRLPDVILDEDPYEIKMLMSKYCNFAYSATGAQRWEKALAKVPFYVCITMNPSESAQFADIVLPPKHHMFENWGYIKSFQDRVTYVSIEQPVVTPLWDCKTDETELAWALAEKLKERGFDKPYRYFSRAFVDPETGNQPTTEAEFSEIVCKIRTAPCWNGKNASQGEDLKSWRNFCSKGVFNSNPAKYKKDWGKFGTKSGTYEFYSVSLKDQLEQKAAQYKCDVNELMELYGYDARDGLAFVPHYEEPVRFGDEDEFPFIFSEHRSRLSREGRSANLPLFQEMKDVDPGDAAWDDVLKINPDDMRSLGLEDGDTIRVTSVQGSIIVHAKAWEGTRPGVVVKCYGQGHWAFGHVAAADYAHAVPRGGNNNELLPCTFERLSGQSPRHGGFARVKIEKVSA
jgi:anaerobic selenocysteine-containing dehydrogenase